jgi:hypothetical protein
MHLKKSAPKPQSEHTDMSLADDFEEQVDYYRQLRNRDIRFGAFFAGATAVFGALSVTSFTEINDNRPSTWVIRTTSAAWTLLSGYICKAATSDALWDDQRIAEYTTEIQVLED